MRGPLNWAETVRQINHLYITDPILHDTIESVIKISIDIVLDRKNELRSEIFNLNLIVPIARHFWLFGNAYYDLSKKMLYNFEDINVKNNECILNNTIGKPHQKYISSDIFHFKRLKISEDVMGTPLPIINDEDLTFKGFNSFHPNELFKVMRKS